MEALLVTRSEDEDGVTLFEFKDRLKEPFWNVV